MNAISRIGVIQPARALDVIRRGQQHGPQESQGLQQRLDLKSDQFDLELKRDAIQRYAEHLCGLLERAGEAGCDLVLLPECTLPIGDPDRSARERLAQVCPLADEIWLTMSAPIARKYGMIIASCYYRRDGDALYNDAVLMDESGEIAGVYHKVHLPCPVNDWDMTEAGVFEAGHEHPVFDTRVGRIGFQICYDIDFPEGVRCLALNGADIILHPTVGYNFPDEEEVVAEARLRTRATDNSVALVYANFGPAPGRSAIYDHNGNQIACCGRGSDMFVFADLELRRQRPQHWGALGYDDHRLQLARKRRPDTYGVLTEKCPPLLAERADNTDPLYEYRDDVGLG